MTGSNVAEQLQRYSTIPSLTSVSLCVATTSLHVRSHGVRAEEDAIEDVRIVKVRGILGSGKCDVREIEILGTLVRWTEEGLECEASDNRRQALLEGLGSIEESKTVNSAAVKPEELGQEEDGEMREGTEKTRFRRLAATLDHMSLDRSDVQHATKEICTKLAKTTRGSWTRFQKGTQVFEESDGDMGVSDVET